MVDFISLLEKYLLNKMEENNYGLVIAPKDPTAFVLGAANELPKIVLQADGQWDAFLPEYEPQAEKFETCGCTVWGSQNALEILIKRITGIEPNYSERYNYILAEITCPGADPHYVCESIREYKVINQSKLPMMATLQDFLMPKPMDPSLIAEAGQWPYKLSHEWVIQGQDPEWKEKMIEALQYSPLAVAVYAWKKQGDLYVRPAGGRDGHWCVIYGYEYGKYWKCFDSYDHTPKKLAWDFGFQYVKRFHLDEKKNLPPEPNWLIDLIIRLLKLLKWR
ncbi:MAG TPA: hypothetical protein V6D19_13125 [Stenomitos sp.]